MPHHPHVRSTRRFAVLIAATIVAASVTGAVVGRNFLSPAQRAAAAAPPAPSLLTAPVRSTILSSKVVFRGDVQDAAPIPLKVPSSLGASLPIVTSVNVRRGDAVRNGEELLRVAERPVFCLTGSVPAFRDIIPGTSGVDVSQLQAALVAAHVPIGRDRDGVYGSGTQSAVRTLYSRAKAQVRLTTPDDDTTLTTLRRAKTKAQAALDAARAALAKDRAHPDTTEARLQADRRQVDDAEAAAHAATEALVAAEKTRGVVVPRGEVVFVPRLPARVIALDARTGALASTAAPLGHLGSGAVIVTGQIDPAAAGGVTVGMPAVARLDTTDTTLDLMVTSVRRAVADNPVGGGTGTSAQTSNTSGDTADSPGAPSATTTGTILTLSPRTTVAAPWIGQNVAVTLTTGSTGATSLVVPVSAVNTNTAGQTYVTVTDGTTQHDVPVTLGLVAGGEQAVSGASLRAGDKVVIGKDAVGQP